MICIISLVVVALIALVGYLGPVAALAYFSALIAIGGPLMSFISGAGFADILKKQDVVDAEASKSAKKKKIKEVDEDKVADKPKCSKGEEICRNYLEERFGKPFPNTRPKWLVNPKTGRCLELDCYNEELKIAVEYNGEQHYVFPNVWHKTKSSFEEQVRRDAYKINRCEEYGIHLVTVPYTVKKKDIPKYIESRLRSK